MKSARWLAPVLAGALLVAGCSGKNAVDQSGSSYRYIGTTARGKTIAAADRKEAGRVTGTLLTGGPFDLTTLKGKVVVLNFWAQWCAPCRVESPGLDSVYRATKAEGVEFVGMDVKDPVQGKVKSFVSDYNISYPIVYDPNARSALQLGKLPLSIGLPWTVVLDKNQKVAAVYNGQVQPADLRPVLTGLLSETTQ